MKYLIPTLQARPGSVPLSQAEFQQLLIDIQVGQQPTRSLDDFVESLNRIIEDLKAMIEAEPFLKPVSKKIAPDYDQLIKNPMDLSTLQKNVKAKVYKSSKPFERDLNLIWTNCFAYNSQETHPIRAQARKMKEKSDHYLKNLRDQEAKSTANASNAAPPIQRIRHNQFSARSSSSAHGWGRETAGDVDMTELTGETALETEEPLGSDIDDLLVNDIYPPLSTASSDYPTVPRSVAFHSRAVKFASSLQTSDSKQFVDASVQPIKPTAKKRKETPPFWFPSGPSTSAAGPSSAATANGTFPSDSLDDPEWWNEVQTPHAYTSGVPSAPRPYVSAVSKALDAREGTSKKRKLRKQEETGGPAPMETLINRNIDSLFRLRNQANKISANLAGAENFEDEDDEEKDKGGKRRKKAVVERSGPLQEKEAVEELRVIGGTLLAHAGFEGANQDCMDTLTTVAGNYLRNIGRTFRLYLDMYAASMTAEEIILHVLFENGGIRPHELDLYIRDDVERQGAKLRDFEKKLKAVSADQPLADAVEPEFGEDDFMFGLPGLDFGAEISSIPMHMRHGTKQGPTPSGSLTRAPVPAGPDFPPPPPLVPLVKSDIPHQIGLLHAFYYARAEHNPPGLEDDASDATGINGMGVILPPKTPAASKSKPSTTDGDVKKKLNGKLGVGKGKWDRKAGKTATTPVEAMDVS